MVPGGKTTHPHAELVQGTLQDQESRGRLICMPEREARETFGERLCISSLGAVEKSREGDTVTEVRVIHDATHGVNINKRIK
eukprot:3867942-Amphidinium_carterae.1